MKQLAWRAVSRAARWGWWADANDVIRESLTMRMPAA